MPMPGARRVNATRPGKPGIMPNASGGADRNTNTLTMIVLSPPDKSFRISNTASMSDPEIAHLEHEDVAGHHPGAGECQAHLGEALIPDAGIEVGRDQIEQEEDHHRQAGGEQSR